MTHPTIPPPDPAPRNPEAQGPLPPPVASSQGDVRIPGVNFFPFVWDLDAIQFPLLREALGRKDR